MDSFAFKERPRLHICGKEYPVDMCSVELVTALVTSFPAITAQAAKLQALQNKALAAREAKAAEEIAKDMAEENRTLCDKARDFITAAIGQSGYAEVFRGRRPNSADHVQLAAHIYAGVLEYRAEQMRPYLNPAGSKGVRRANQPSANNRGKK